MHQLIAALVETRLHRMVTALVDMILEVVSWSCPRAMSFFLTGRGGARYIHILGAVCRSNSSSSSSFQFEESCGAPEVHAADEVSERGNSRECVLGEWTRALRALRCNVHLRQHAALAVHVAAGSLHGRLEDVPQLS